jgi:hypothetical protein
MIKKNRINKTTAKGKRPHTLAEPKNFAHLLVKHWLKKNANRFLYLPRITEAKKNGFSIKFKGITSQIMLRIYQGWALEVWAFDDKGNWWDILTDFDLDAERDEAGRYYCSLCIEEPREFYSSKRELWEKHSMEPALAWANENLRPDRWLCLFGGLNEGTQARLVDADKLPESYQGRSFYAAYPLEVKRSHPSV